MLIQKQYNKLILLETWNDIIFEMFFIIEEAKETVLDFLQETVKVL